MRTNFASEPIHTAAVRDFAARLAKGGLHHPIDAALCLPLAAAQTRADLLSAADAIVADLAAQGVTAPKDLILEGAAAFFGLRNWDTLAAKMTKAAKAPTARAASAPPRDIQDLLVRRKGGVHDGERLLYTLYHVRDTRPFAPRVVVTEDGWVRALEGLPPAQASFENTLVPRGRNVAKAVEAEALRLAYVWLFEAQKVCDRMSAAGFFITDTGGGLTAWSKPIGGTGHTVRVTDVYGSCYRFSPDAAARVVVSRDDEDDVAEACYDHIEQALADMPRLVSEAVPGAVLDLSGGTADSEENSPEAVAGWIGTILGLDLNKGTGWVLDQAAASLVRDIATATRLNDDFNRENFEMLLGGVRKAQAKLEAPRGPSR